MGEPLPFAFHDLPASAFPISIVFRNVLGVPVHRVRVDRPGVLHVPPLAEHGPLITDVLFADGGRAIVDGWTP